MQVAGDNAGLLMGKDLSVQLETTSPAITPNYINSLLSICASGPISNSRLPSKVKYQANTAWTSSLCGSSECLSIKDKLLMVELFILNC